MVDDDEEEWLRTTRLPVVPLSAAVDDTPADVKTTFKGKFFLGLFFGRFSKDTTGYR